MKISSKIRPLRKIAFGLRVLCIPQLYIPQCQQPVSICKGHSKEFVYTFSKELASLRKRNINFIFSPNLLGSNDKLGEKSRNDLYGNGCWHSNVYASAWWICHVRQDKVTGTWLWMAPTETEGGGASLKDTQEILLNKSSSMSFYNPALYYQYVAAKCCN